jgi:hypothetical protein
VGHRDSLDALKKRKISCFLALADIPSRSLRYPSPYIYHGSIKKKVKIRRKTRGKFHSLGRNANTDQQSIPNISVLYSTTKLNAYEKSDMYLAALID